MLDGTVPCDPQRSGRSGAVPVRLEVAGVDTDSAVRDLAGIYAGKQWLSRHTEGDFAYRYTAVGDAAVTLHRSQMSGFLRGATPPGDAYVVQWITRGHAVPDIVRDRVEMRPNEPTLFPTDREFVFIAADYDQQLVHLDRGLVREVATERFDVDEHLLRFDHLVAPSDDAARRWRESLGVLARTLREGGVDSLAWTEAKRAAARAFLLMYPPHLDDLPAELSLPRYARLRAAVEYIHAHAEQDITITDIAGVAGLSVRSVQEAFRRVFDVPPLGYVRQVRLDRVHEELLALDPRTAAVGEVARRWGFAHLGRFSAAYADRFGEYPKQTLRR